MDWPLAVGQVMVEVNGIMVDLFENLRLVGNLEAFTEL
jgi:hypothetical protein